ncbi:BID domain-containing T4SS effector [Bartonella taylorii]|uniref:BID domain-containing T4SS effector n=1 Tax=Bartonella taylorii TaxID=33046 RepID=UPI001ABAED4D|nr:BID domain-containing T4SS effector [Bartonella taylorii]
MKKQQGGYSVSPREEEKTAIHQAVSAQSTTEAVRDLWYLSNNFFFFHKKEKVLKNLHGIKETQKLKKQYALDIEKAKKELRQEPLPKHFDSTYLAHIHHSFFKNTFEWAGRMRHEVFTFADGSRACTPYLQEEGLKRPFAAKKEMQQKLNEINEKLVKTNNLQGLTRKEFVEHTAKIMTDLHYTYPFRAGNIPVIQFFAERIGQAAGHELDFSLVRGERENSAYAEAINNGNIEPMCHLLEDISNPKKVLILKEFTQEMKKLGLNLDNYGSVVVAQEGLTYHGTYQGNGQEVFMIDVNGTLVLGSKKDLSPKQLKKLKIGDPFSFTAPLPQKSQDVLIPEKTLAPLSQKEIVNRIQNDPSLQERKQEIRQLCKTVYGKSHILEKKLRGIEATPSMRNEFLEQISGSLRSFSKLAGFEICGLKNRARVRAEQKICCLEFDVCLYVNSVISLERDIIKSHFTEKTRFSEPVGMPSKQIQELFSLSKEQQKEVLSASPELEIQVCNYLQKFKKCLLPNDHEAIKNKNYTELAESLDVSINQAERIAKIFTQTKKIANDIQKARRSKVLLEANEKQPVEETRNLYEQSFPYLKIEKGTTSRTYGPSLGRKRRPSKMEGLTMKEKYDQEKKEERNIGLYKNKSLQVKPTQRSLSF